MSTKLNIHTDIKNKLKYFVDTNKIPHIIFHGESGSGKREIVNFLINDRKTAKHWLIFCLSYKYI